jgi:hypothetical protein
MHRMLYAAMRGLHAYAAAMAALGHDCMIACTVGRHLAFAVVSFAWRLPSALATSLRALS